MHSDKLASGEKRKIARLRGDLLRWFSTNGRELPWRHEDASIFQKIVVEVLLQRTTASAVARFYHQFFARFPDWLALAEADSAELELLLKPLGLWRRRADSLAGIAEYAAANNGRFPTDPAQHSKIPAVGQYVSNAIMMFQHGKARPLLDVNMARVIERFVRPRRLADIRYDPWLQEAARWYARGPDPERANWAILDFAAAICKARKPLCPCCPVRARCAYFQSGGKKSQLPV
jgi:A/G-specific adenine glycosylase